MHGNGIYRDKRKVNVEDYILDGKKDATLTKVPGSINGNEFNVKNCEVRNLKGASMVM